VAVYALITGYLKNVSIFTCQLGQNMHKYTCTRTHTHLKMVCCRKKNLLHSYPKIRWNK